jgi:nucleotide-binding universal stress UspA family protein
MSFADILLRAAPHGKAEFERLSLAVDLAQRLSARLDGVFVAECDRNASRWARTLFDRAVSKSSVETTWRMIDGRSSAALLFQVRRSDLAILPPAALLAGADLQEPELMGLESGRPVLVLPEPEEPISIGHTILVGWDESRESARAIHDALPILANADKVVVLTVITDDDLTPLGDRRLLEHLHAHGVPAELARRHGDPPEEIAAEIRRIEADMLVIGLRRAANAPGLGDVGRRFIRTVSLPVFLSA